jgi:hypothetical protein
MHFSNRINKIIISILSLFLFIISFYSLIQHDNDNNKPTLKLKEFSFEDNKLKVFIPNWDVKVLDNNMIKLQSINSEKKQEISFGYEETEETLESYWVTNYRNLKDMNPDNLMTVQDTYIGNIQSKLLFFKGIDDTQLNSCMHHAYWNNKIIHYNYLTKDSDCQDSFFKELSKIAIQSVS